MMRIIALGLFFWILCLNALVKYGYSQYIGIIYSSLTLHCNTTSSDISLLLWYKNGNIPIYSRDARLGKPIATGNERMSLNGNDLIIKSLNWDDGGEYRCRVDYRNQPTLHRTMSLIVVDPPSSVFIKNEQGIILDGNIGPFNEDNNITLFCIIEGGIPMPSLDWYINSNLSLKNSSKLSIKLERHLFGAQITCSPTFQTFVYPINATIKLNLNLKPLTVKISSPSILIASQATTLKCISSGSYPSPTHTWTKGSSPLLSSIHHLDDNTSISSLVYTPLAEDNGEFITCKVVNKAIPESITATLPLNVHYPPKLSISLGAYMSPMNIKEGIDVILECNYSSYPNIHSLTWYHNNVILITNTSQGVLVMQSSLVLQKITLASRGDYICSGTNSVGQGKSKPFFLRVQYAPICSAPSTVHPISSDLIITCSVNADPPNVSFTWYINNSQQIHNHSDNGINSTILYKAIYGYGVVYCRAQNDIGIQKEPCIFRIIPMGPQTRLTNCSIHNTTFLYISCDMSTYTSYMLEVYSAGESLYNRSSNKPYWVLGDLQGEFLFIVYGLMGYVEGEKTIIKLDTRPIIDKQIKEMIQSKWLTDLTEIMINSIIGLIILIVMVVVILRIRSIRMSHYHTNISNQRFANVCHKQECLSDQSDHCQLSKGINKCDVTCLEKTLDFYDVDESFGIEKALNSDKTLLASETPFHYSSTSLKGSTGEVSSSLALSKEESKSISLISDAYNQIIHPINQHNHMKNLQISCDGSEVTISFKLPRDEISPLLLVDNKTTRV